MPETSKSYVIQRGAEEILVAIQVARLKLDAQFGHGPIYLRFTLHLCPFFNAQYYHRGIGLLHPAPFPSSVYLYISDM